MTKMLNNYDNLKNSIIIIFCSAISVQPFRVLAKKTNSNWMNISLYGKIKLSFVVFHEWFKTKISQICSAFL